MAELKKLSDVVEEALRDELSTNGRMLTGFVGVTTYINDEGETSWRAFAGSEQTITTTTGMIETLRRYDQLAFEKRFKEYL